MVVEYAVTVFKTIKKMKEWLLSMQSLSQGPPLSSFSLLEQEVFQAPPPTENKGVAQISTVATNPSQQPQLQSLSQGPPLSQASTQPSRPTVTPTASSQAKGKGQRKGPPLSQAAQPSQPTQSLSQGPPLSSFSLLEREVFQASQGPPLSQASTQPSQPTVTPTASS
ncbi:uncharacterized protein LOC110700231 [Chenopodium quinoa]|uniref:uncharacterized protein LOC110700231 n=1 Tax=Chenopodium quinoa TaxID=63459 RepID=UPI000B76D444|nr:uncharacterized protein LOC110700231 [Chenopodium quinoa]